MHCCITITAFRPHPPALGQSCPLDWILNHLEGREMLHWCFVVEDRTTGQDTTLPNSNMPLCMKDCVIKCYIWIKGVTKINI